MSLVMVKRLCKGWGIVLQSVIEIEFYSRRHVNGQFTRSIRTIWFLKKKNGIGCVRQLNLWKLWNTEI